MKPHSFFRLPALSVIDIVGNDAATIVHNLTTNQVQQLEVDQGHECFVTDVRGKTLGHVLVYRHKESIRLIGPGGQSERITQHLDRYTIREDATPTIRDSDFAAFAVVPDLAATLADDFCVGSLLRHARIPIGEVTADCYGSFWLGAGSCVVLVDAHELEGVAQELASRSGFTAGDETEFHRQRILARFPWFGIDLDESNLPQEADRDALAISFTKGCYLGQETVARLDALGQVQKKLVVWSLDGPTPPAGTALTDGDKTVGRLTSVTERPDGGAIAIGPARRSHFESGSVARGISEPDGAEVIATVL